MMHDKEKQLAEAIATLSGGYSLEELRQMQERPRFVSAEPSQEAVQALQTYWERVYSTKPRQVKNNRSYAQIMPYSEGRKKVAELLDERAAEITAITGRPFCWDIPAGGELAAVIRGLIQYFTNDPASPWPIHKGLLVYGMPGAGKTEIMRIFQRFASGTTKAFEFTSFSDVYTKARMDKSFDFMNCATFDRCFDEFLRHTGAVSYFGDQIDVNEALIEARYTRNRNYGQITHFITNGDTNTVQQMLSAPAFDRVRGMCSGVEFPGESKR